MISEYRLALSRNSQIQVHSSIKEFEETVAKFADCAEGYALYGQVIMLPTI